MNRWLKCGSYWLIRSIKLKCVIVLGVLACYGELHGQRDLREIPDPDPELERRSLIVADGFEVNLFTSDPSIAKPIQINFDAQGRLWIASSETYPQIRPGEKANDKILVVEDTDEDGCADKVRVFADGLLIPTGVLPGDGGVYVACSTQLLHLRDTDGDGRADERRVVLNGFGTEDTHHLLHTLRWGHDGAIYMNQSIYIHSHVETPYGVRRLNGGGIWRFRPTSLQLEIFCRGFVNPWGHHFDFWGQSFATDGAYGEGINYVFPGAVYVTAPGATRRVVGLNPGSPKHCGLEIISGRHFPDDWQGNMITNDFRANRVCRFVVTERDNGAGYISRQESELIRTTHVAFRPVDVKMGPDGALYIADWYNPIIQHGEVDFRDPRRDHVHGRIWRVTAKGRPLVPRARIVGAPVGGLLELLKAPEEWVRLWAKLELRARDKAVVRPALEQWLSRLDPNDSQYSRYRLEALWCFQTIDEPAPELLRQLLADPDGRIRAAAVRVLSQWRDAVPDADRLLDTAARDPHGRVRLEAVRGLAQIPSAEAAIAALAVLDQPMDDFLDFALWQAMRDLQPYWLPALRQGTLPLRGKTRHLVYALSAVDSADAAQPLLDLLRRDALHDEQRMVLMQLVVRVGGAEHLQAVWNWLVDGTIDQVTHRTALLRALAEAERLRKIRPKENLAALRRFLQAELNDDGSREQVIAALELATVWKLHEVREECERLAVPSTPLPVFQSALEVLTALAPDRSQEVLARCAADGPLPYRLTACAVLTRVDRRQGLDLLLPLLPLVNAEDAAAVMEPLLRLRGLPHLLAEKLKDAELPPDTARRLIQVARREAAGDAELVTALEKAGRLEKAAWRWNATLAEELLQEVAQRGDPARGQAVYRRADLQCMQCHAIAGAGGTVGPDLASIGASAQPDYILESLLAPGAKVKENYHAVTVVAEGRVYTGIPVRRNDQLLVLRDAKDQEITIPVASIEEQQEGRSLMPDGSVDPLTRQELVDLVRFLCELGKVGEYSVGKEPLVRSWQALQPTPTAFQRIRRTSYDIVATDDPAFTWTPLYATVQGYLPLEELPSLADATVTIQRANSQTSFLRTHFDFGQPGSLTLRFTDATGLTCWWDGKPTGIDGDVLRVVASSGRHQLTIAVDRKKRTSPLRVMIESDALVRTAP